MISEGILNIDEPSQFIIGIGPDRPPLVRLGQHAAQCVIGKAFTIAVRVRDADQVAFFVIIKGCRIPQCIRSTLDASFGVIDPGRFTIQGIGPADQITEIIIFIGPCICQGIGSRGHFLKPGVERVRGGIAERVRLRDNLPEIIVGIGPGVAVGIRFTLRTDIGIDLGRDLFAVGKNRFCDIAFLIVIVGEDISQGIRFRGIPLIVVVGVNFSLTAVGLHPVLVVIGHDMPEIAVFVRGAQEIVVYIITVIDHITDGVGHTDQVVVGIVFVYPGSSQGICHTCHLAIGPIEKIHIPAAGTA